MWCFSKDQMHLEHCPSGKVDKAPAAKGGHIPQIGRGGVGGEQQHVRTQRKAKHRGGSGGQCFGHEIYS